jgi:ketosteroid isomerase-like protein
MGQTALMSEQTDETRAFLTAMFDTWSAQNDPAPFVAALSDDLVWTVTGTSPIAGVYRGKADYLSGVLRPLGERLVAIPTLRVLRMLVDGAWASLHLQGRGAGKRGENYDMDYCWMIRVQDQQIVEVIGFYDTTKVNALFAP